VKQLVPIGSPAVSALVAAPSERASIRFLESFAANIRNPHTRPARPNSRPQASTNDSPRFRDLVDSRRPGSPPISERQTLSRRARRSSTSAGRRAQAG
jgi:hypothetical protein